MSVFKVTHEQAGGHVHCSLFASKSPNFTYAKCGDFVVRAGEEFEALKRAMSGAAFHDRTKGERSMSDKPRNRVRCKHCGDVIESKRRHDFVTCKCGRVYVDGGQDYARRGFPEFPPEDHYEEMP